MMQVNMDVMSELFNSLQFVTGWVFDFCVGNDFLSPYEQEEIKNQYSDLISLMCIEGGDG